MKKLLAIVVLLSISLPAWGMPKYEKPVEEYESEIARQVIRNLREMEALRSKARLAGINYTFDTTPSLLKMKWTMSLEELSKMSDEIVESQCLVLDTGAIQNTAQLESATLKSLPPETLSSVKKFKKLSIKSPERVFHGKYSAYSLFLYPGCEKAIINLYKSKK